MKLLAAAVASTLFCATSAFATPSTHVDSQTLNFSFPLSPGNAVLTFNKFDPTIPPLVSQYKELQKVVMSFNVTIGAHVTAENDSQIPSEFFGVNLSGFTTVNFGSLAGFVGINKTETVDGGIGASDGVSGSGPDFHDFGFVSDKGNNMQMTTDNLASFVGPGTMNASIFGSGGFSVSGVTDSTLTIANFGAFGSVTIEYHYKIVPAPAAAGALAMLGLAGVRRRRA